MFKRRAETRPLSQRQLFKFQTPLALPLMFTNRLTYFTKRLFPDVSTVRLSPTVPAPPPGAPQPVPATVRIATVPGDSFPSPADNYNKVHRYTDREPPPIPDNVTSVSRIRSVCDYNSSRKSAAKLILLWRIGSRFTGRRLAQFD